MGITMSTAEQSQLLGPSGDAVLATSRTDGTSVPLPVWYVVLNDEIFIRTPATAKRLRHIARNSAVGFLVHAGHAWEELRGVLITANAEVVSDERTVHAVQQAMNEQFAGRLPPPLPLRIAAHSDDSLIVRLSPLREPVSWDNRKIRT